MDWHPWGKWFELKESCVGINQVRRQRTKLQAQKTRAESPRLAEHGCIRIRGSLEGDAPGQQETREAKRPWSYHTKLTQTKITSRTETVATEWQSVWVTTKMIIVNVCKPEKKWLQNLRQIHNYCGSNTTISINRPSTKQMSVKT